MNSLRVLTSKLLGLRIRACQCRYSTNFNQPKDGRVLVRTGGIASLFRLPIQENDPKGLDACFVGIPMDHGSNNRSGARLGPRAIRQESSMIRNSNMTGACPFESLQVADIGDVPIVPYSIPKTVDIITEYYSQIMDANCVPLTMGGDHTISFPILRAIKKRHGRVGLILVDAHADLQDNYMGEKVVHGTPFRRAIEEDLIDPRRTVQIGLRGSMFQSDKEDIYAWAKERGIRQIFADQCWHKSLVPLMKKVRDHMKDIPVYFSFDIDALDCGIAPGTGYPEVAGLTPIQAMEIMHGLRGLNIIGGDVAEVNPLYDSGGVTSLMAATLLFELLCVLPGVKYMDNSFTRNTDWI